MSAVQFRPWPCEKPRPDGAFVVCVPCHDSPTGLECAYFVGDLNTPAPDGAVYQLLLGADYIDVWTRNRERGEGLTGGHDSDLRNRQVNFIQRNDFILVRNRNRGNSPLWPVVATIWGD